MNVIARIIVQAGGFRLMRVMSKMVKARYRRMVARVRSGMMGPFWDRVGGGCPPLGSSVIQGRVSYFLRSFHFRIRSIHPGSPASAVTARVAITSGDIISSSLVSWSVLLTN